MCARVVNYPVEELHKVHNFSSVFMLLVVVFYLFNCVPQVRSFVILRLDQFFTEITCD